MFSLFNTRIIRDFVIKKSQKIQQKQINCRNIDFSESREVDCTRAILNMADYKKRLFALKTKIIDSTKCTTTKSLHQQVLRNSQATLNRQSKQFNLGNSQTFTDPINHMDSKKIWRCPHLTFQMAVVHFMQMTLTKLWIERENWHVKVSWLSMTASSVTENISWTNKQVNHRTNG